MSKRFYLLLLLFVWAFASVLVGFSTYEIGYRGLTLAVLSVALSALILIAGVSTYWNHWHSE